MLVFFDTEFTDFAEDAKLISIGLVTETGDSFYAELSDTYTVEDCSDFVIEHVLPLLEGGNALMTFKELQSQLYNWLEALGEPVTLVTDSVAWDGYWLRQIFASAMNAAASHIIFDVIDLGMAIEKIGPSFHHARHDANALYQSSLEAPSDACSSS